MSKGKLEYSIEYTIYAKNSKNHNCLRIILICKRDEAYCFILISKRVMLRSE